ncbi:unnamed protein product [Cylindrotheca closterium]|uniref:DUF6824 domain-containing protein n=1 Tax=Cylindrotheca closterium TaxID=2856 RepID=A0AAD2FTU3_9STRA|nr:unnamed protein product [Cylindrotheca closterium]
MSTNQGESADRQQSEGSSGSAITKNRAKVSSSSSSSNHSSSSNSKSRAVVAKPIDIICGRGFHITNHRGNLDFHLIVNSYRDEYLQSKRPNKTRITKQIIKEIHATGARFIRKVSYESDVDTWEEVDYATAYKKVSHALRLRTANETNRSDRSNGSMEEGDTSNRRGADGRAGDSALDPQQQQQNQSQVVPPTHRAPTHRATLPGAIPYDPLSLSRHPLHDPLSLSVSSQLHHAPRGIHASHASTGHLPALGGVGAASYTAAGGFGSLPLGVGSLGGAGLGAGAGVPPPLSQIYRETYLNTLRALQQQQDTGNKSAADTKHKA